MITYPNPKRALVIVATIAAVVFVGTATVFAWTGPTATPPGNNTAAPLDTSATSQTKAGDIAVHNISAASVGTTVGFCIGANCITSWPSGSTSQWTTSGSAIYYNGGNVGIGTSAPGTKLDIVSTVWNGIRLDYGSNYFHIFNDGNAHVESAVGTNLWLNGDNNAVTNIDNGGGNTIINGAGGNVGIGTASPGKTLDVNGVIRNNAEIISSSLGTSGQFRMISNNYGAFFRNDGSNTYLLMTNSGDQYGGWNSLRPFYVNDSTGVVTMNNGLTLNSNISVNNTWGSSDSVQINGNQIWNGAGGNSLYLQNANWNGAVVVGGQSGYSNDLYVYGNVHANAFLYNSDRRLKTDIAPLDGNLTKLLVLEPVSWLWKDQSRGTGTQIGFIAQDVQKVIPELVHTDASTTLESIDYARMTPIIVGSVQELNQKIVAQQTQIDQQQKKLDELETELNAVLHKQN